MSFPVVCAVLLSALLHASWNAVVRGSGDKIWTATILCMAMGLFACAFLPFVPLPKPDIWLYVTGSAFLHVLYNCMLARSYRRGDLSVMYSIARGSSPLLVTLGAIVFINERLGAAATAGLLLISAGIVTIGIDWRQLGRERLMKALPDAFGTGVTIAAYSVVDGIGVRQFGSAVGYASWMFVLTAILMPLAYGAIVKEPLRFNRNDTELAKAGLGGIGAAVAYAIIIWAMQSDPLGLVASLRETSIVFAAVLGRMFLSEKISFRRGTACSSIAAGAILIALSRATR